MNAWIFTGGTPELSLITERPAPNDLCIAADVGLTHARTLGVPVSLIVGDFDSLGHVPEVDGAEVITLPAEKDVTDTQCAISQALERGAESITLVGGLGGRLDHTLSNLALLEQLDEEGVRAVVLDGNHRVRLLHNDRLLLANSDQFHYLSLLCISDTARGVCIDGVKYPLKNATLERRHQFAISNEIVGRGCLISVRRGKLLVVESR